MSEGLSTAYGFRKMVRLHVRVAPSEVYLGLLVGAVFGLGLVLDLARLVLVL
jgi:hypothetical protein